MTAKAQEVRGGRLVAVVLLFVVAVAIALLRSPYEVRSADVGDVHHFYVGSIEGYGYAVDSVFVDGVPSLVFDVADASSNIRIVGYFHSQNRMWHQTYFCQGANLEGECRVNVFDLGPEYMDFAKYVLDRILVNYEHRNAHFSPLRRPQPSARPWYARFFIFHIFVRASLANRRRV